MVIYDIFPLLDLGKPFPEDEYHIHLPPGETRTEMDIRVGSRPIWVFFVDENNMPRNPPVFDEIDHYRVASDRGVPLARTARIWLYETGESEVQRPHLFGEDYLAVVDAANVGGALLHRPAARTGAARRGPAPASPHPPPAPSARPPWCRTAWAPRRCAPSPPGRPSTCTAWRRRPRPDRLPTGTAPCRR